MSALTLTQLMLREPLSANVRLGPEDRESIAFANRLREWTISGRLKAVWTHPANEAGYARNGKGRLRMGIAKALGLIPGTPDFMIVGAGWSLLIEMKSDTGRQSPSQRAFQAWAVEIGIIYRVCRSADEAEEVLWGVAEGRRA